MRKFLIHVLNKAIKLMAINEESTDEQKMNLNTLKGQQGTSNSIQAKRVVQWFKDEGDKTLRLNYDLDTPSMVFDLGGYEGQWSSDIYSMYNCTIFIFEPHIPFAESIKNRFQKNPKIKLFEFGLGGRNEVVELSILDNSSSIFQDGPQKDLIKIISVVDFLKTNNIQRVDLIKINIEGAEYELLETILDHGLIKTFKNIQVQFHDFIIENAAERMQGIQQKLSSTHRLTYHYEFVWENWEMK